MSSTNDIRTAGIFDKIAYAYSHGNADALPVLAQWLAAEAATSARSMDERQLYTDAMLTTAAALHERGFALDAVKLLASALDGVEPRSAQHASIIQRLTGYADTAALTDAPAVAEALIKSLSLRGGDVVDMQGARDAARSAVEKCYQIACKMDDPLRTKNTLSKLNAAVITNAFAPIRFGRETLEFEANRPMLGEKLTALKAALRASL